MYSLNGKTIDFKDKFETVVSDYSTDTTTILTKNGLLLDLSLVSGGYYKQDFVKTRVDLYVNKKDTLAYTYGFFKDRLFQIRIYSNSDSINRVLAKKLQDEFKVTILAVVREIDTGHFSNKTTIKKTDFASNYKYNKIDKNNTLKITMTYQPIIKYLPLWCSFGKKNNWETKMEKKLTKS